MSHKPTCPDCGNEMQVFKVPNIHLSHFEAAHRLAATTWGAAATGPEPPISVVCLTAALLLKRAAVAIGLPVVGLHSFVGLYLDAAHDFIMQRRRAAAAALNNDTTMN